MGHGLFAFTDVVLDRSQAYLFAVSPPNGASWPPPEMPDWYLAIADASAGWCAWIEGDGTKLPGLVAEEWAVVCEHSAATLDELATGRAWRICQALLTLRVLPRVRNPVGGPSIRSLSRYVCVRGPEVDAVWNRIPARTIGPGGTAEEGNVLMLPWPLRIDAEDFKPTGAVERAELEPYGFFEFAPAELLLPPGVRWWEAMAVPGEPCQVVELGEGVTLVWRCPTTPLIMSRSSPSRRWSSPS